jgi:hypothetical protein
VVISHRLRVSRAPARKAEPTAPAETLAVVKPGHSTQPLTVVDDVLARGVLACRKTGGAEAGYPAALVTHHPRARS